MICATNIDLDTALRDGRLREDLYFRINTITVRVPPLRERTEDIPLLCTHFVEKFNERYRKSVKGISPAAYQLLIRNRWPGNVRELENAIERAVLVAKGVEVQPGDLPETMRDEASAESGVLVPPHHTLAEIEKMAILQTLQRTNWNKQEAAHILGLVPADALQQDAEARHRRSGTRGARGARDPGRRRAGVARSGGIVNDQNTSDRRRRRRARLAGVAAELPVLHRAGPRAGARTREGNLDALAREAEQLLAAVDQVRQRRRRAPRCGGAGGVAANGLT